MVKRYSHTAIVSGETDGEIVHGEYIPGSSFEIEVKGQYFSSNSGNQLRLNALGKEFIVKGEFSTKHKKVENVMRIVIKGINIDAKVESWEQFQTHSVIYI